VLRGTEPVRVIARNPDALSSETIAHVEIVAGSHGDPEVVDKAPRRWDEVRRRPGRALAEAQDLVKVLGPLAPLARFADLDDQVEAARRIFASDRRWTVVRGSDLEEGESQGLPVWSRHVGDPILESNITRRVDFALFMVEALDNDQLVHEAPAIVGRQAPSALAYAN
jgi:uncharacterized protein YbjT (DUF2867 family)